MELVACKNCGGAKYKTINGFLVCEFCGSQVKKIDDKQSTIDMKADVNALLEKCRKFPFKASRYAKLVLDIDPNNKEALKYLK